MTTTGNLQGKSGPSDKTKSSNKCKHSKPKQITDDDLVAEIVRLAAERNQITADLVAHIAEMDARKLYRDYACSSMYTYVTTKLGMSEGTAYKLINVGRSAREFPMIHEILTAGETHLSGLLVVIPHLTDDNHRELLTALRHKSKRQAEKLIAERFPKPPVPELIRRLPGPKPAIRRVETNTDSAAPISKAAPLPPADAAGPVGAAPQAAKSPVRKPDKLEPLAAATFKIQLTADQQLVDRIERAKALLGPRLRRGELNDLFSMALDCLVEKLEKKKFGKTSRRRPKAAGSQSRQSSQSSQASQANQANSLAVSSHSSGISRHIPNEVKRQVVARDHERCTFVDANGNRCGERWGLEFHHAGTSFAKGGAATVQNITLHCRAHNQLVAEREFGRDFMRKKVLGMANVRGSVIRGSDPNAEP